MTKTPPKDLKPGNVVGINRHREIVGIVNERAYQRGFGHGFAWAFFVGVVTGFVLSFITLALQHRF